MMDNTLDADIIIIGAGTTPLLAKSYILTSRQGQPGWPSHTA
jgi:hypothetical protein